jgi:alkylation response protein AidB-like acyl-CoA dehydrogenase
VVLEQIGEAAMRIDTAWLHTRRAAKVVEDATMTGPLDAKTGARCRADAGYAMAQVRQAVDTLMNVAGTSAFAESNPLQRIWRDVNVASRHGYLASKPNLELYGRAYCGVEPSISMF